MFLPEKTWPASGCTPSQSASACCWPERHTDRKTHTHTVTCQPGISAHARHQALGWLPAATPFWGSQKTTGLAFDLMPTIHHLKSKREKKDLSCQLLGKHRLLWKEKGRRRDRNRSSRSVPAQRCRGETGKRRKRKPRKRGGEEGGQV